jgi:hypothetical protein
MMEWWEMGVMNPSPQPGQNNNTRLSPGAIW